MARTVIPIVTIPSQGAIENLETLGVASDAVNDHSMVNDGKTELWVINTDAALVEQVTVKAVADPTFGRAVDLVDNVAVATGLYTAGPFKPAGWNQPGTGLIHVDVDQTDANIILVGVRRSNDAL